MTRATKVMLEQYEAQIASLKRSYKSFKADLEKLDDKSLFYETNAIRVLLAMKELKDEYTTLENVIHGIKAANEELELV